MRNRREGVLARGVLSLLLVLMALGAGCSEEKSKAVVQGALATGKPEIRWRESKEPAERSPISLTASDGSGLELVSLEARTVIEDPLAFTELHLTFHNPEARRREGRFEITLPQRAAVSRFAMRVAGAFQEGEVVERRRAQQIYEDFLHRKQDPALLEKDAGNEFAARVFPIEPNEDKQIIIAYSEELVRHDEPYRVLLKGLPSLREINIEVRVGSNTGTGQESTERERGSSGLLRLAERDFVPLGDLEVHVPGQKPLALRNGTLVLARVAPVLSLPDDALSGLTVLFDTSASRALGFGAQIERLGVVLEELRTRFGKDFDLRITAFDQSSEDIYRGPVSGFGLREKGKLLTRDALGASDLGQALAFLAQKPSAHDRVLLISDGVITAGAQSTTALREGVAKLAAHGVKRFDVLVEGGITDRSTLQALTSSGLPSAGVLLDPRRGLTDIVDRLQRGVRDRVEVQLAGATWIHPKVLQGVQAGDERLVYAELPANLPVQIELIGAGASAMSTMEVPRPLLERAWAGAKIDAMSAELAALHADATSERQALEQAIVRLSIDQRVVSDHTALLVLETEGDYRRFGIAREALTSILRVGKEGIELFDRRSDEPQPQPLRVAAEAKTDDEAWDEPLEEQARFAEPETGALDGIGSIGTVPGGGGVHRKGAGRGRGEALPRSSRAVAPAAAAPAKNESAPSAALRRAAPASTGARAQASASDDLMGDSEAPAARVRDKAAEGSGALVPTPDMVLPKERTALVVAAPFVPHATIRLRNAQGISSEAATQVLKQALTARARQCYARAAERSATPERLVVELSISDKGSVRDAFVSSGALSDRASQGCILAAARALRFPKPESGNASVEASVELSMQDAPAAATVAQAPRPRPRPRVAIQTPRIEDAYDGVLAAVMQALREGNSAVALAQANAARAADPGDVIGLVALGEALEATADHERAARVYGSIIDLFPSRADLRRMAAARLLRLPKVGLALAADSYRHAVEQRPDHPAGPRGLAYALLAQGQHAEAFDVLARVLGRSYDSTRFEGVERILREDLAMVASAWSRVDPTSFARAQDSLSALGIAPDAQPSLRFVLSWETDANDVDFHIYDGRGGHAYYMKPKLGSKGSLYADITTGYGPECFAIPGRADAYPYVLQAHYFARGPMGFGMGSLQAIEHDGSGNLTFTEYPFVIMKDKAFVELARIQKPERTPI